MNLRNESGNEDALAQTAEALTQSFANSFVTPLRAQTTCRALHGVTYVSIAVPANSEQVISVGNLAAAGPLHMTLVPSSQSAAGHTLQYRWAFTTSSFGDFRDVQVFPEAAEAAALMCHPLLERPPLDMVTAHKVHKLLERTQSAPVPQSNLEEAAPSFDAPAVGQREQTEEQKLKQTAQIWQPRKTPEHRPKPPIIGALLLGLKGNEAPQKRDVEQLAHLLGPLVAPMVSKAVDMASAAYLARTLARQSSDSPAKAAAEHTRSEPGSHGDIQRVASDSWILTHRERALLQQLLGNSALTQRSISTLPWRGASSPLVSPLMSSMDVAARCDSGSSEFTFMPCLPLVDPPCRGSLKTESSTPSSVSESSGSCGPPQPQPIPAAAEQLPEDMSFLGGTSPPAASGQILLLGPGKKTAALAANFKNPFAGAVVPPAGGAPHAAPPPPAWGAATAACWGDPSPGLATLLERTTPLTTSTPL